MIVFRPERPGDRDAICAVHEASFPTQAEARLVDDLRAANRLLFSLVAEDSEQVVGHVAFNPVTAGSSTGSGLGPVAVLPGVRMRGIASMLIREGLACCTSSGVGFVVVFGDPRYYARFGFRAASEFGLWDEYRGGPEFQVIELQAGAVPVGAGRVSYAPEFQALGEDQE